MTGKPGRKPLPVHETRERLRIGATIRAIRLSQHKSADDVATPVGVSPSYVYNIESGLKRLTPELAEKLAAELGVPLLALVHPDYFGAAA